MGFDVELITSKTISTPKVRVGIQIRQKIVMYLLQTQMMKYPEIVDYLNYLKIPPIHRKSWTRKQIGMMVFSYKNSLVYKSINKIISISDLYFYLTNPIDTFNDSHVKKNQIEKSDR